MLTTALAISLLSVAPPKLAAARFNVVDLGADRAEFYTEYVADRLVDQGLEVVTNREIASMLGLERQKELLGCSDETTSCAAELANALGVDALLLGDVAKLKDGYQFSLKVIHARTGKRIAAHFQRVASEPELLEAMIHAAELISAQVAKALEKPLGAAHLQVTAPAPAPQVSSGVRKKWWIPGAVAVVGLAVGVGGLVAAESSRSTLANATLERSQADAVLQSGMTTRALGLVGIGVGAAAACVAAGFLIFGESSSVTPVAIFTPDRAVLGISGSLP